MSLILKYTGLCFSVVIIIVLVVLYIGSNDNGLKAEEQARNKNQTEKNSEQYKMFFCFEGDQSQIIDLIKGKAKLNMIYSGNSKFTAKLFHPDGTLFTVLADINGPYKQNQIVDVPETGSYMLDVKTSGEWSLSRE